MPKPKIEKINRLKDKTKRAEDDMKIMAKLEDERGVVLPEDVLEAAAPEDHPWHDRFQWEDSIAGRLYRIDQARQLIRSIHVRIITTSELTYRPAYVHNPQPEGAGYIEVKQAAKQRDVSRAVLDAELKRIRGTVNRGRALAHEFGMTHFFEVMLQQIVEAEEALKAA